MNQDRCPILNSGGTCIAFTIQKGGASVDDLTDESPMPFGKYKGTKMCNVPDDYLRWLYDQGPKNQMSGWGKKVREYSEANADSLKITILKPKE